VKILVVDDERAIRFSLAELLESDGHDVREAPGPSPGASE
jgi:CheY-like chemotaxis protein